MDVFKILDIFRDSGLSKDELMKECKNLEITVSEENSEIHEEDFYILEKQLKKRFSNSDLRVETDDETDDMSELMRNETAESSNSIGDRAIEIARQERIEPFP
ncbi:MAG: hypothetical protein CL457_00330 [Acidimicrobiaceae bacterium]|nr:hypothetical protein [Acidimicrobiaceae bacterium]